MKTQIKIHPKIGALQIECENLVESLACVIVERDRLINKILPQIDAKYTAKFGELIKSLLKARYEAGAMKRRIELVQAQINRGEKVFPFEIERKIEIEFQTFLTKIREQEIKNREAEYLMNCGYLSVAESRELNSIYRNLAKKLHPDFVGNRTKKHHEIWLQVSAAYNQSDLHTLRSINLIIDSLLQTETILQSKNSLEELKIRRQKLVSQTELILAEIAKIRKSEKFTLSEKLEDEIWCDEQKEIFLNDISIETAELHRLTAIFQNLLASTEMENNDTEDWAEIII